MSESIKSFLLFQYLNLSQDSSLCWTIMKVKLAIELNEDIIVLEMHKSKQQGSNKAKEKSWFSSIDFMFILFIVKFNF